MLPDSMQPQVQFMTAFTNADHLTLLCRKPMRGSIFTCRLSKFHTNSLTTSMCVSHLVSPLQIHDSESATVWLVVSFQKKLLTKSIIFCFTFTKKLIIIIIIPADRNVVQKEEEKKLKYKSLFVYRDTTNVEPQMYDCTSNNWSHWNSNEKLKEKFGNYTRKTLDRFTTKDSYTWNITHNTESTAM